MKQFFLSLLLLLGITAGAQTVQNNQIVIGKVDSIRSNILKETRGIWVYVPKGADDSTYSKKRYPVVYLLDGDSHFMSVVGLLQQLSQVNGNTVLPEMIIVAIPNTDRTRDLTPTNSLSYMGKPEPGFKTSGGGGNFIQFIEKELMPHINSKYPTAPYKMLIGHSFGGLTVMNALINHTALFNSYIAIDPSMWWDAQKLLKQTGSALQQKRFTGKSLYLGIANTMKGGLDTTRVRKDTAVSSEHIRSILRLKDVLQANPTNGLQFAYSYYPNDSHGSVPLIAEYDALRSVLGHYTLPKNVEAALFDPANKQDVAALISAHYQEVSRRMGYTVYPSGDQINSIAYYFLGKDMLEKAYPFFALNIQNYPQSANAYDSMGDYYVRKKDKRKAVEYFRKALAIKEVKETREKLDKVIKGK